MLKHFVTTVAIVMSQQAPVTIGALEGALRAPSWEQRAAALSLVTQIPESQARKLADALADVLKIETDIIWASFLSKKPVSEVYGEGYGEYVAKLQTTLLVFLKPENVKPKHLSILLRGVYSPGSAFTVRLAEFGPLIVEPVTKCMIIEGAHNEELRINCMSVIGALLGKHNDSSDPVLKEKDSTALMLLLRDELSVGRTNRLRTWAARAIAASGDVRNIDTVERELKIERIRAPKGVEAGLLRALEVAYANLEKIRSRRQ